ncbi:MAG: hypothetical protein QG597_5169, partial [Actinomycetota bacterium]|nr:hypothetical protein [Actinomycetota bacterium]
IDAVSPAQVLAHRITRGRPDHDLTASPAHSTGGNSRSLPTGIPQRVADRLHQLYERAADRATELGRQLADAAPEWAIQALGHVPPAEDAADRADWEQRAGVVAAHREAVGHTDPEHALPPMPGLTAPERRASYVAAWTALGRPETDLTEAEMTEGRLRIRAQAWQREQAWQPPYVDDDLRATEADLDTARQAAAVATARAAQASTAGDDELAAKWLVEADTHRQTAEAKAAAVDVLTHQAETHSLWVTHTAVTRDLADRARAEAERRGLDLATPPEDTTTATDWLAEHAAAVAAEDAWRPITDADVTDTEEADDLTTDSPAAATEDTAEPAPDHPADQPAQEPPALSGPELELATSGTAAVLAVLADRASQETAHTAAIQEDLAIQASDAGRRRRELADLDTVTTEGASSAGQDLDDNTSWDS